MFTSTVWYPLSQPLNQRQTMFVTVATSHPLFRETRTFTKQALTLYLTKQALRACLVRFRLPSSAFSEQQRTVRYRWTIRKIGAYGLLRYRSVQDYSNPLTYQTVSQKVGRPSLGALGPPVVVASVHYIYALQTRVYGQTVLYGGCLRLLAMVHYLQGEHKLLGRGTELRPLPRLKKFPASKRALSNGHQPWNNIC
jgi:hypothetical protein